MPGTALVDGDSDGLGMASTFWIYQGYFSGSNLSGSNLSLRVISVGCADLRCQTLPYSQPALPPPSLLQTSAAHRLAGLFSLSLCSFPLSCLFIHVS